MNFIHTWKHDKLKFTKSRCSNTKKIGEFDKYATKTKSSKEKILFFLFPTVILN